MLDYDVVKFKVSLSHIVCDIPRHMVFLPPCPTRQVALDLTILIGHFWLVFKTKLP
jgi:hypothetical protein